MTRSLTYIEIDIDYCALVYGVAPCAARLLGSFVDDLIWDFDNTAAGWTGNNATLTPQPGGLLFEVTGADPFMRSPAALTIDGAISNVVRIVFTRVNVSGSPVWDGTFYYQTGGHGESGSFRKTFANNTTIGERTERFLDMSALTAGGTDWITNTITRVRADFGGGDIIVHSISVGHYVGAEEATGTIKCFNTAATCQDRENFDNQPVTLRFAKNTDYLPKAIDALPYVRDVGFNPAVISLGESLGERATLTVEFEDYPHSDTGPGFDKYLSDRPYDPFRQGTFFGKFRARQPFLIGRPIRLIRGELGQDLADMETRHYVIEAFSGPDPQGRYSIEAKDVLKLADDERAQAPRANNGVLNGNITNSDVSATLSPSGIGNAEYDASGYVCIGGNEVCAFTRSGDTLTLTRAQFNTGAVAHNANERVQEVLRIDAEDPSDIIALLLEEYAGVDPAFLPVDAWRSETENFLDRLYSATITEPTGVNKLISEVIEQAALAMWWDDGLQQVRLMVLRNVSTEATELSQDLVLESSLAVKDQPAKRISQVWTFYGQRDPTKKIDEESNYKSALITIDEDAELEYQQSAIKKIYARWIPEFGNQIAARANDLQIGRHRIPPRQFAFDLFRKNAPFGLALGAGFNLTGWSLQDATGAVARVPVQITRLDPGETAYRIEAEEALFANLDPVDLFNRVIIIQSNNFNLNLRQIHDTLYPEIFDPYGITVTLIINAGVILGSNSVSVPALDIGDWVPGVPITVRLLGRLQGKGGRGAQVDQSGSQSAAEAGGPALYTRYPINLDLNTDGELWSGGGGGGAAYLNQFYPTSPFAGSNHVYWPAGAGGAGANPGSGRIGRYKPGGAAHVNLDAANGTTEGGGLANHTYGPSNGGYTGSSLPTPSGGDGGDPGQAGDTGTLGPGPTPGAFLVAPGAAGPAIDGDSYVTISVAGDIRGPQIN